MLVAVWKIVRFDLLPVRTHVRALEITVSECHLACIAGIRMRLSSIGDRCGLWSSCCGPTCHNSSHNSLRCSELIIVADKVERLSENG